ncbi:MAG: pantoate--beta-alanine ligase [Acidobacteriota bacterium]
MKTVADFVELRDELRALRAGGRSVGFVPTMGALHEGHLSLVRRAKEENDHVVVSIYVNPAQFGPEMDLDTYPRDPEGDAALLDELGVDLIFHPDDASMYPDTHRTWVEVEGLTEHLDGASRPGYFRGICTVVLKLLNLVAPDRAYFGEKDIQQALVLRRLCADLFLEVQLTRCPTVREPDGLAMSSRNLRLAPEDRESALSLHRGLSAASERWSAGERDAAVLMQACREIMEAAPGVEVDYVQLVDLETMQPLETVDQPACLAVAVDLGAVRLIDNVLFE